MSDRKVTNIEDLEKQWDFVEAKELHELQKHNAASFQVIIDLQKKNHELQEEIKSLKTMLESTVPRIQNEPNDLGISNELLICETQIYLLKEKAMISELTKEDATKLQIYVDILETIKKKPQPNSLVENASEEDLLNIVHINANK